MQETRLTQAEWERAIGFLTETGQACTDTRQEFILLSDVLGLSMLVETINGDREAGATESTVLGPFHMTESPVRELGANIDLVGGGEPCVVSGRVVSGDGTPLPGALLDVWQADGNGFYDVQRPDVQPPGNGRGLFTHGRRGPLPVPHLCAEPVPHPHRRPGRRPPQGDRPSPLPPPPTSTSSRRPTATPPSPRTSSSRAASTSTPTPSSPSSRASSRTSPPTDDPSLAREFGIANPFRHARFDLVLEQSA